MGVLDRFERRLDRIVSSAFARAFKAEVQPVEIASALQRECDDRAAIVGRDRTIVPNVFTVELGEHDHERLSAYAEPLATELSDMVREHAGEQRYVFVGPLSVAFERADDLDTGLFRVRSQTVPGARPAQPLVHLGHLEVDGAEVALDKEVVVLGRGSDVDVQLDDPGVSRRHAVLRLTPTPTVEDLGSTNGTLVDGRPVRQAALVDGSTLLLGTTTVVFRTDR